MGTPPVLGAVAFAALVGPAVMVRLAVVARVELVARVEWVARVATPAVCRHTFAPLVGSAISHRLAGVMSAAASQPATCARCEIAGREVPDDTAHIAWTRDG
jgi:hypothetical protein